MIRLDNLITTNHRNSGKSKYDRKLTEFDVVATRIRYSVNVSDERLLGIGSVCAISDILRILICFYEFLMFRWLALIISV